MSTIDIQSKIVGLDAIERRMRGLPNDVRLKGARFAGRRAALKFQQAAAANALQRDDPETREQIAKNLVVRFSPNYYRRTGDVMFRTGILGGARSTSKEAEKGRRRRERQGVQSLEASGEIAGKGSGNPGGDTFYWRHVEFGTNRSGAFPFIVPAFEQAAPVANDTFAVQLSKWLDRYLAKQAKGPA